jgi:hypothetical protein
MDASLLLDVVVVLGAALSSGILALGAWLCLAESLPLR